MAKQKKVKNNGNKLLRAEMARLSGEPCLIQDSIIMKNRIISANPDNDDLMSANATWIGSVVERIEKIKRTAQIKNKFRLARNVAVIKDEVVYCNTKSNTYGSVRLNKLLVVLETFINIHNDIAYEIIKEFIPDYKVDSMTELYAIHRMFASMQISLDRSCRVAMLLPEHFNAVYGENTNPMNDIDSVMLDGKERTSATFVTYYDTDDKVADRARMDLLSGVFRGIQEHDGLERVSKSIIKVLEKNINILMDDNVNQNVINMRKSIITRINTSAMAYKESELTTSALIYSVISQLLRFVRTFIVVGAYHDDSVIAPAAIITEQTPINEYVINEAGKETYYTGLDGMDPNDMEIINGIASLNDSYSEIRRDTVMNMIQHDSKLIYCYDARMLERDNVSAVYEAVTEMVVRFNPTPDTLDKIYNTETIDKCRLSDIKLTNEFDMVIPRYSGGNLATISETLFANYYGDHISVQILDRDHEDIFNDIMFRDGECICNDVLYDELYDDMWNLDKRVMVVRFPGVDGFMMFDNDINFRINTIDSMNTAYARCPFVRAVKLSLAALIKYINNGVDKGFININFIEHDYLKGVKRDYTSSFNRKGTVVRAHFRHYKSGIITLVKPHIRRGTVVANGKVVVDIK